MRELDASSQPATVEAQASLAPTRNSHQSFYRPELDALRFFAFLGVFQFHYAFSVSRYVNQWGAPHWLILLNSASYAGAFGVDLFFVLSAYLITELLLREKRQRGSLDVRAFYIRRILRIWPLYFFCIALALIPYFNATHSFSLRYVLAFLLLAGNWSIVAWGPSGNLVVGPLWTISVEEQFYLLWPPLVRRMSSKRIVFAAAAMVISSFAVRAGLLAVHANTNSVRYNTLARIDPIAAGILVAVALRGRMPNFSLGLRLSMLCCGLAPLVLMSRYWKINNPESLLWVPTLLGYPVVAACCTLILIAVLGISLRPPRLLAYLGKISYGLYVYHFVGLALASRLVPSWVVVPSHNHLRYLALREALGLGFTVVLASVSYVLLEKPFLNLKKRFELVDSRPV